jgi:hypothetical protein
MNRKSEAASVPSGNNPPRMRFALVGNEHCEGRFAMPIDAPPPQPNPKCEKCGELKDLAAFIPRFGDRPALRIFDCPACKALTWVTEVITGYSGDAT